MDDIQSIISMTDSLLSIIILLYALSKMSAALSRRTDEYTMHLNNEVKFYRDMVSQELAEYRKLKDAHEAAFKEAYPNPSYPNPPTPPQ